MMAGDVEPVRGRVRRPGGPEGRGEVPDPHQVRRAGLGRAAGRARRGRQRQRLQPHTRSEPLGFGREGRPPLDRMPRAPGRTAVRLRGAAVRRAAILALACMAVWALGARLQGRRSASRSVRYDVAIEIRADGSLRITEVIDYDFGQNQRHGIFRDVPTRLRVRRHVRPRLPLARRVGDRDRRVRRTTRSSQPGRDHADQDRRPRRDDHPAPHVHDRLHGRRGDERVRRPRRAVLERDRRGVGGPDRPARPRPSRPPRRSPTRLFRRADRGVHGLRPAASERRRSPASGRTGSPPFAGVHGRGGAPERRCGGAAAALGRTRGASAGPSARTPVTPALSGGLLVAPHRRAAAGCCGAADATGGSAARRSIR